MIVFGILGARLLHVIADGHFYDYVNLCFHPERVPAYQPLVNHCFTAKECGFHYLCDPIKNVCHPPKDCFAWIKFWNGGLAYYGGFLLATAVAILYTRRHKMPFLRVADLAAPAIALGLFFGRIGCFLNGCCYGKPTFSIFGLRFPVHSLPWVSQVKAHMIRGLESMIPVHPTQLYEAVGSLFIFLFTYFVVRKYKRNEGQVLGAMMVLYALLRSLCEVFRDDERGVLFGVLSTSQMISIPLFLLGMYLLVRKTKVS